MNILRSRRTLGVTAALIIAGASYAAGRATASASNPGPTLAGFGARSYAPGQVAVLNIEGGQTSSATLQIFQAGASGTPGPAAAPGWDKNTFGKPVTEPEHVRRPAGAQRWLVHIRLGSTWASGAYVARLTGRDTPTTRRSCSGRPDSALRRCSSWSRRTRGTRTTTSTATAGTSTRPSTRST
jgi:hypothetical protein